MVDFPIRQMYYNTDKHFDLKWEMCGSYAQNMSRTILLWNKRYVLGITVYALSIWINETFEGRNNITLLSMLR